jgi:hypothetical protein
MMMMMMIIIIIIIITLLSKQSWDSAYDCMPLAPGGGTDSS